MEIIISSSTLNGLLSKVKDIASSNNESHPEFKNILIKVFDDQIDVIATNSIFSIKTSSSSLTIKERGEILVASSVFVQLISKIKGDIAITTLEDNLIEISSGSFQAKLTTFEVSTFPSLTFTSQQASSFSLTKKEVEDINSQIAPISVMLKQDENMYGYVFFDSTTFPGNLYFSATDNAIFSSSFIKSSNTLKVAFLKDFLKIIASLATDKVDFSLEQTQYIASMGDTILLSRSNVATDEKNGQSRINIIKNNFDKLVKVNKSSLINSIEKCQAICETSNDDIHININNNAMEISIQNHTYGNVKETIEVNNESNSTYNFDVSIKYLSFAINNSNDNEIVLSFTDTKPNLIKVFSNQPNSYIFIKKNS